MCYRILSESNKERPYRTAQMMWLKWQRPTKVSVPKVWGNFMGNVIENGQRLEFVIQDVTEDMYPDVLLHMSRYFLVREPLCSTVGIVEDERSKQEIVGYWADCLIQQMSLVCLAKDGITTRIAGCSLLSVRTKEDIQTKFSGEIINRLLEVKSNVMATYDVFRRHRITEYMSLHGLSVNPMYNGDGVGLQLLRARESLCRATGIKVTSAVFTAEASQELATLAGFDMVFRKRFDEIALNGEFVFKRLAKKSFTIMEKLYP